MRVLILIASIIAGMWLLYDLLSSARYWQNSVMLVYVGLIIFSMLWQKTVTAQVQVGTATIDKPKSEENLEEIILNIIRGKGNAKRHDLMPHIGMSKSSLVRLLDEMESKGLIVQMGDRKAAYYTLPEAKKDPNQA